MHILLSTQSQNKQKIVGQQSSHDDEEHIVVS